MTTTPLFSPTLEAEILGLILDARLEPPEPRPPPIPTRPVPHRERSAYLHELKNARESVKDVPRENLVRLMDALPKPISIGERVDLEWLAWRDAILERALALGYIVGQATERTFQSSKDRWSVEAAAACGTQTIRYPIGGPVSEIGTIPVIGRAILMTRGSHAEERWDHRNRPYIPVSTWFLHDPVSAQ